MHACVHMSVCLSVCLSDYHVVRGPCKKCKCRQTMRCFERDFMLSLSGNYQTDIIEAFISTSRYLDLLNIKQMVPTELQLNKANYSVTYIHTYIHTYIQLFSKIFIDSNFCHTYFTCPMYFNSGVAVYYTMQLIIFLGFINAYVFHCNSKSFYLETDFISGENLTCNLTLSNTTLGCNDILDSI